MQPHDSSSAIRVTLDISVPTDGGPARVVASRPYSTCDIVHPGINGTTLVKDIDNRWYMCTHGTVSGDVRHVFARVYEGTDTPDTNPPAGKDTGWASTIGSTSWKIDLLPLPANTNLGTTKKIAVWHETGTGDYKPAEVHTFTATSSTYTYCDTGGVMVEAAKAKKPIAKDWSILPDRWQFQIAGVSNASSCNCACLNGTWLLRREGGALLWRRQLESSFADPKRPSWWRLAFNQKDGFWYLECVGDHGQPTGTSISYRRHESAWDPCGANELVLLTNHGYCHVPDFVTVYPA